MEFEKKRKRGGVSGARQLVERKLAPPVNQGRGSLLESRGGTV